MSRARVLQDRQAFAPGVGFGDGAAPSKGRLRAFRVVAVAMCVSAVVFGLFTIVFGIVG